MTDKTTAIAIWGLGKWGRNWLKTLYANKSINLLYAVDTDETLLSELAKDMPDVRFQSSVQDTLADPTVVGVVITAPVRLHATLALQALQAGKHVFVEKPLCMSLTEYESIKNTSLAAGRQVMTGHLLAFYPLVNRLRLLLAEGTIGQIKALELRRTSLGRVRKVENVVQSFAVHDLVIAMLLTGAESYHASAYGWGLTPGRLDEGHVKLDCAGIPAHIYVNWLTPHKERRVLVSAEQGVAELLEDKEGMHLHVWKWVWGTSAEQEDSMPLATELIVDEHDKTPSLPLEAEGFLAAIRTGKPPLGTDLQFTGRVMQVLDEIEQSLKQ